MGPQRRHRGCILTPQGYQKLTEAIQRWEYRHQKRCTQEQLKDLTSAIREGGLDVNTIRKIQRRQERVDRASIECLFTALALTLGATDLTQSTPTATLDPDFVGRESAIAALNELVQRGSKIIVIQARGGVGKTKLAVRFFKTQGFDQRLELWMAKETPNLASAEGIVEEWLRRNFNEEPGQEFGVTLERLRQKLRDPKQRIGILIDNLETALDSVGKFLPNRRAYVDLLRVLADSEARSVTLITSRERCRESSISLAHYLLNSLDVAAWEQYFQHHQIQAQTERLAALHHVYNGNAKAMKILCSTIHADYNDDLETYWQTHARHLFIERDLEDLVLEQFARLEDCDPTAYQLLCRIGCYRFQDVRAVPFEGISCLLWDVPDRQHWRVVEALQDRSLLDSSPGEYWLHPVIQIEAIERLRSHPAEWEQTHRAAAAFWQRCSDRIQSPEDAIHSFEAYYHYREIQDFEQAAAILLRNHLTQAGEPAELNRFLCRFGLVNPILEALKCVLKQVTAAEQRSRLYLALGFAQRLAGQMHQAIQSYQQALHAHNTRPPNLQPHQIKQFSQEAQKVRIAVSVNLGLCKIRLWELKEALDIFGALTQNDEVYGNITKICIAYLHAFLDPEKVNDAILTQLFEENLAQFHKTGVGFRLIFLGDALKQLGHDDLALTVLQKSMEHSEAFQSLSTKAAAMSSIAGVYRQQQDFAQALDWHQRAIAYMTEVKNVWDRAEAYYQLGLTHHAMANLTERDAALQKAIKLFSEMQAPQQVAKVQQVLTD